MRRSCLLALGVVGCSPAPTALPAAAPELPAVVASASAAPPPSASAAPAAPAAPEWVVDDDGTGQKLLADPDDAGVPAAPCYGARVYRGAIAESRLTLRITADGGRLSGLAHYDVPGPGIAISGELRGDAFTLDERGAGRFEGKCVAATGALTGSYALKGKKTPFFLSPRPAGEAAIHLVRERLRVTSPAPSHCQKLGKTKESQVVKEGICLPTDPAALAALQEETGAGLCTLELRTPRLFGLANPAAERAANAALTHDGFGYASPELRAAVKRCPAGDETRISGGFTVLYNAGDVLTVSLAGSVNQANAAHAATFGPETVVVDLATGKRLAIGDVVTDEKAFHDAIVACDEWLREDVDWDPKGELRKAPRWAVVPGGLAVVVGDVPPIKNGMQGRGPIASFASLARRKLLRADSPVARLWAGVAPAQEGEPFCPARLGVGEILAVRRKAPKAQP